LIWAEKYRQVNLRKSKASDPNLELKKMPHRSSLPSGRQASSVICLFKKEKHVTHKIFQNINKKAMDIMLQELMEIPQRAQDFWKNAPEYNLPVGVPYLGMGSSYFAPLAFKYMGVDIQPEIASEFFYYLKQVNKLPNAVILSQSGKSTEALWCSALFEKYTGITNNLKSPLSTSENSFQSIDLMAGEEQFSSSKTFVNTLLALFKGFGFDASTSVDLLVRNFQGYIKKGEEMADLVFDQLNQNHIHGMYILGSGPNIGIALNAALILSESTKKNFHGMAMAQYDHGPKETAKGSIVVHILSKGESYDRAIKLNTTIEKAGALVLTVEEPDADENFSILQNIIPFNFMAYFLSKKLGIVDVFEVGGKVTEVE
jgi:glutamine---fructose-6-phosphate transaminase (isomerizing)